MMYLVRGLVAKALPGAVVQQGFNCLNLLSCGLSEFFLFWEVLSYQAICILVRASFPGVVRVAEVNGAAESFRGPLVPGKLAAVVVRDRMQMRVLSENRHRRFVNGLRSFLRQQT